MAQIKEHMCRFQTLDKETKQKHLQQIVMPLIELKMAQHQLEQVSRMLVDLEVFELDEVLEMFCSPKDLKERVEEAHELIKESQ